MPYMLVDAVNTLTENGTHLLMLSSCMLLNTTELQYYCADTQHDATVPIALQDLNTLNFVESLCGNYSNYQLQGKYQ